MKTKLRKLYTHVLETEKIGVRDDNTEYERIDIYMKCDVDALVEEQKKEFEKVFKDYGHLSELEFYKKLKKKLFGDEE